MRNIRKIMKLNFNKVDVLKVIAPLMIYYAFLWFTWTLCNSGTVDIEPKFIRGLILLSIPLALFHLFDRVPISMIGSIIIGLALPFAVGFFLYLGWCVMNLSLMPIETRTLSQTFFSAGIAGLGFPALNVYIERQ